MVDNCIDHERIELLYQHGGLKELDYDYYQGECPDNNH
jgi:hypothetical protein